MRILDFATLFALVIALRFAANGEEHAFLISALAVILLAFINEALDYE